MWDWLMLPIDASRPHDLSAAEVWHARSMFFAWIVVSPLAILMARYFKVLPGQDWPVELDSKLWWRCHWIGHTVVFLVSLMALIPGVLASSASVSLHGKLGYAVICLLLVQVLLGLFRGSKGGPTDTRADATLYGDHYNMSNRRYRFEQAHKFFGYLAVGLSLAAVFAGLWTVNAPHFFWLLTILWCLFIALLFYTLQSRGFAMDTYQAIWGPDTSHPGNRLPPPRWGMHRRDR